LKAKPLLIKFANLPASAVAKFGDYDAIFPAAMGLEKTDFIVVDPMNNEPFPPIDECSAVVVSGAAAMITDNAEWSLRTEAWIKEVLDVQVPVLAVCYGQHLLTRALGGTVDWCENGLEGGLVDMQMTAAAAEDPVFSALPQRTQFLTHHSQGVAEPPPGAVELARNEHSGYQAYSFEGRAWGVQFHPEVEPGLCEVFIDYDQRGGRLSPSEANALKARLRPTPQGPALLRAFARTCGYEPAC